LQQKQKLKLKLFIITEILNQRQSWNCI